MPADALKGLLLTRGHQSVGFDLMTLTQVLRPRWDELVSRTGISDAELTDAELLAERLLNLLSSRKELRDGIRAATLTRAQAFKLFMDTYGQVRRAVLYLRYEEGDADEITPSPYRGRVKRRGKVSAAKASAAAEPERSAAPANEPAQLSYTAPAL